MRTVERGVLVGIVVAVGAALRWAFAAHAQVQSPLREEAGQYARYAQNLIAHGVYSLSTAVPPPPDSFRPPGYPLLLAACRLAGGDGWLLLTIGVQVVLGALTVLLCYRLARAWLGFLPALAAAMLCALSPHLVVSSVYVLPECTTTFLLTAGLWAVAGAGSRLRIVAAGLLFGAAAACNEVLLLVPLVVAWPLWRTAGAEWAALLLAVALLPSGAWTLRNGVMPLHLTGEQRAIASISHGSYPGMVYRDPLRRDLPYREDPEQPTFGSSWFALEGILKQRVAAEPLRYASWYLLEKPVWLWGWNVVQGRDVLVYDVANSPYEQQSVMAATHWVMRVLHIPLMVFAAAAALVAARNARRRCPGAAQATAFAVLVVTLVLLAVVPDPRYLQPVRPLVFVMAATGIAWLAATVASRLAQRRAAAAAATS